MNKFLFVVLCAMIGLVGQAQGLNAKYIKIQDIYAFQETTNEYRIQDFLKNKLTDLGYIVLSEKESLPNNISKNNCEMLTCIVEREPKSLSSNLVVKFVNCNNAVVYSTKGVSRLKIRDKSYPDALRNAFDNSVLKIQ